MGLRVRLYPSALSESISKRVPTVQRNVRQILNRYRNYFLGFGLTFLAIGLGWQADHFTREEALREWSRTHPPSIAIWTHALESQGYLRIRDPKDLQSVLRTLPTGSLQEKDLPVWMTPDASWIIPPVDPEASSETLVFKSKDAEAKPHHWQPLPSGWAGFEMTLHKLNIRPKKPASTPPKASSPHGDPRALLY
jgi:hypothetical protein